MELVVLVNVTLSSRGIQFVRLILYWLDIEENARMKSTPASSVAMQTLRVVQRVKLNNFRMLYN